MPHCARQGRAGPALPSDAGDARIDRWLVYERRRVNRGYDDWRDEEVERASPTTDVSVGEIFDKAVSPTSNDPDP